MRLIGKHPAPFRADAEAWHALKVNGRSMLPCILDGCRIFGTVPSRNQMFRVGDIVTYLGAGGDVVTHRIIAMDDGGGKDLTIRVRGDFCGSTEVVARKEIIYMIVAVQAGGLTYTTNGHLGRLLAWHATRRPIYWRFLVRMLRRCLAA